MFASLPVFNHDLLLWLLHVEKLISPFVFLLASEFLSLGKSKEALVGNRKDPSKTPWAPTQS